jgi:hypothetical protein
MVEMNWCCMLGRTKIVEYIICALLTDNAYCRSNQYWPHQYWNDGNGYVRFVFYVIWDYDNFVSPFGGSQWKDKKKTYHY